jgi:hypothetical protein
MPNRPIVGTKAFCSFVEQMREAYPDLSYEVQQVGAGMLWQRRHCSITEAGFHMTTAQTPFETLTSRMCKVLAEGMPSSTHLVHWGGWTWSVCIIVDTQARGLCAALGAAAWFFETVSPRDSMAEGCRHVALMQLKGITAKMQTQPPLRVQKQLYVWHSAAVCPSQTMHV